MELIYSDDFHNLSDWHTEGEGEVFVEAGAMHIHRIGGRQGGIGCHAFCREDFPDTIALEYELLVRESDGLLITFLAFRGLNGEDAIEDLPPREGFFKDYVGPDARARSYHVSVSRYDDDGVHTGVCNWRRNPGLNLMAQGEDLCKTIGSKYSLRMEKRGSSCALFVDGLPGPSFVDPGDLADEVPSTGKIGFRAIGSRVIVEIRKFRVYDIG